MTKLEWLHGLSEPHPFVERVRTRTEDGTCYYDVTYRQMFIEEQRMTELIFGGQDWVFNEMMEEEHSFHDHYEGL